MINHNASPLPAGDYYDEGYLLSIKNRGGVADVAVEPWNLVIEISNTAKARAKTLVEAGPRQPGS